MHPFIQLTKTTLCTVIACAFISAAWAQKLELKAGETLQPGEGIYSQNGEFVLIMENSVPSGRYGQFATFKTQGFSLDRNSVMSSEPTHSLGKPTGEAQKLSMQDDGNLALYDYSTNKYLWDAQTHGKGGTSLRIENDGSISLYNASNHLIVWHNVYGHAPEPAPVPAPMTPSQPAPAPAPAPMAQSEPAPVSAVSKWDELRARFPHDSPWSDDNVINFGNSRHTGCSAFAMASFYHLHGENAIQDKHTDYNRIKVGDIVRINGDTHSVIILDINADNFILAEGNMGGKMHWGRALPKQEMRANFDYAITPKSN